MLSKLKNIIKRCTVVQNSTFRIFAKRSKNQPQDLSFCNVFRVKIVPSSKKSDSEMGLKNCSILDFLGDP